MKVKIVDVLKGLGFDPDKLIVGFIDVEPAEPIEERLEWVHKAMDRFKQAGNCMLSPTVPVDHLLAFIRTEIIEKFFRELRGGWATGSRADEVNEIRVRWLGDSK
jgi:hypothetical protein